jgi:TPR repeat protein
MKWFIGLFALSCICIIGSCLVFGIVKVNHIGLIHQGKSLPFNQLPCSGYSPNEYNALTVNLAEPKLVIDGDQEVIEPVIQFSLSATLHYSCKNKRFDDLNKSFYLPNVMILTQYLEKAISSLSKDLSSRDGDFLYYVRGTLYDIEEIYGVNDSTAFQNKLATDKGDKHAQLNIGFNYQLGKGVTANKTEAFRYYKLAADQGDTTAQYNVGNCYRFGRGVTKNESEACRYYKQAADQGHLSAQIMIGQCHLHGNGVTSISTEVFRYHKLSTDQGEGHFYFGLFTTEEGFPYLKKAADHGFVSARTLTGH